MADTNIKYLKEHNLLDAHKQFMRIVEGYGYAAPVEEADDDQDQNPMGSPNMNGANPMSQGDNQQMPNDAGGQMPGMENPQDMGQDNMGDGMNGSSGMPQDGSQIPDNGMNDSSMAGNEDPLADTSIPTNDQDGTDSDDTEVDVTNIVKAQEKTNDKVNDVGRDLGTVDRRIEKLLGALEDMQGVIDKNNAEIADLKNEFEKRNPTQTEKLNLRSLDSYPFNIKPTDYWKQKDADSNYSAYADNDEPTTKEYVITNDDVDNVDSDIANTFDVNDDDIQDLNKIFNLK